MGGISGLIGKLLSFTRVERNEAKLSDLKVDVGGGDVLTAEYTNPTGEDAVPLKDDYVTLLRINRSGRVLVVGFVETDAQQTAQAGEKRFYARNEQREEMVQLWLKNDGTALISNENGSCELRPDGSYKVMNDEGSSELRVDGSYRIENNSGHIELQQDGVVNINGATILTDGTIVSPTAVQSPSVVVDGKELKDHTHLAGNPPGNTGPNN